MFARVHIRLWKLGKLPVPSGDNRLTWTVPVEEAILQYIEQQPSSRARSIASRLYVSYYTIWGILNVDHLNRFHLKKEQLLQAHDCPKRVEFCEWSCRKLPLIPIFKRVTFSPMKRLSLVKMFQHTQFKYVVF